MNTANVDPTTRNSEVLSSFQALRPDVLTVSLVMHLLALALPLALLQIYDRILPAQAYGTAVFLVIGVGLAILLEAVLRYGRMALFASIGARYEAEMLMRAFRRLLKADIAEVEKRGTATVTDAIRAIGQVRDFWSGQAGAALYEAPFIVVYLLLIAYVGGWLVLIPLVLFVIAVTVAFILNPAIKSSAAQVEKAERLRRDFTWTAFAALDDIKGMGAEGSIAKTFRGMNDRYMTHSAVLETRMGWIRENATALGQISTVLIVAFGAGAVMVGELTTGALAACTMLAGRSISPAMASLGYWSQLARVGEAQARVNDMLNLPDHTVFKSSDTAENDPSALAVTRGEVRIEAPGILAEAQVIKPGEVVYLDTDDSVLASRMLGVIAGLAVDPQISITVDGHVLQDYRQEHYREAVMLVARQLALVPGSILNNLTYFDSRYNAGSRELCEELGLQAHLDRLRHGVLTEVGPGTAEHLDEGIYQRIALIRALVRQPRVLLLDHAASGIDLDGIKKLAELLKSLQGKTTVIIATYKEPLVDACTRRIRLSKAGG